MVVYFRLGLFMLYKLQKGFINLIEDNIIFGSKGLICLYFFLLGCNYMKISLWFIDQEDGVVGYKNRKVY